VNRRAAVVALLVAAACSPGAPLTYELEYPGVPGRDPVPTTIVDATGLLAFASPGSLPARVGTGMENPAGRPEVIRLEWLGGPCDEHFRFALDRVAERRVRIVLTTRRRCGNQAGVPRMIDFGFRTAMPISLVEFVEDDGAPP
jgi:hypothetical protein